MQRAYKYLIAGLAVGLVVAAVGTFMLTSGGSGSNDNGLGLDCSQCHAEGHGSVVAPNVNLNGTILLTGDSPRDEYVVVDSIFTLPQRDIRTLETQKDEGVPSRGVPLLDFLSVHGVNSFDDLVVYADDFMLALNRSEVSEDTIIVPEQYSIRILGSNMPVATWLKGVRTIVVVGGEASSSITLNGKAISFGRMLDHGVQTTPASLKTLGYDYNGTMYRYDTAFLITGIGLKDLLLKEGITDFTSVDIDGVSLSRNGVLTGSYFLTRNNGTIVMATADKNRGDWPEVKSITVA